MEMIKKWDKDRLEPMWDNVVVAWRTKKHIFILLIHIYGIYLFTSGESCSHESVISRTTWLMVRSCKKKVKGLLFLFFFGSSLSFLSSSPPRSQVTCSLGNNGCTGTVPTIFTRRQQTWLPEEDPGQQARGQTFVQHLPEDPQEALPGAMRTPFLLVLFQQGSEVRAWRDAPQGCGPPPLTKAGPGPVPTQAGPFPFLVLSLLSLTVPLSVRAWDRQ